MIPKRSLGFCAVVLIFFGAIAGAAPRNVVLVVADDHGLDVGCYGGSDAKTPHLDALARESTRFTNAYCTVASCSASRSVILSGLQNHANGMYGLAHAEHNFHARPNVVGLPNLLRAAGYHSILVGKFHVQPEAQFHFDTELKDRIPGGAHNPVAMAERCREALAGPLDKPFFLYFCPTDTHRAAKGFANEGPKPGVTPVVFDPKTVHLPPWLSDTPEAREEWADYLQAVSRLDQGVGKLVEVLKATGHWNDTLFIYCSDNGAPWPGAKTTQYESGTRLPLIVRSPDQKTHGGTTDAMVTWADLTPTILDFAHARGPGRKLHGRSFLSTLDDPHPKGWDETFGSHTFHEVTMYYPMRTIRTRKYKLIWNIAHPLEFPFASDLWGSKTWQGVLQRGDANYGKRTVAAYVHRPEFELYDIESDPGEINNLAASGSHAEVLADLKARLKEWQAATNDPWSIKYSHE